jgi:hypothetical protein
VPNERIAESEFDYPLTTPFEYSKGGEQLQASFVRLTAPTSRKSKECGALKQAFFRSVPQDRDAEGVATKEPEGHDIIMMMAMSTNVELSDVLDVARRLFVSGVAMIDGEVKLTGSLLDRMSQDDFEEMLGSYLITFTLASTLEQTKESSSPES